MLVWILEGTSLTLRNIASSYLCSHSKVVSELLRQTRAIAKASEHLPVMNAGIWGQKIFTGEIASWLPDSETALMPEGHKVILKPKIHTMCFVMLEKHSNKDSRVQKSFIVKWNSLYRNMPPGGRKEILTVFISRWPLFPWDQLYNCLRSCQILLLH
jgi:hypothetical protein